MRLLNYFVGIALLLPVLLHGAGAGTSDDGQAFLGTYCSACHGGGRAAGGMSLAAYTAPDSLRTDNVGWNRILIRVRSGEMPPKGAASPSQSDRDAFASWLDNALRTQACAGPATVGPWPMRRLNRDEYSATIRDLLDIQIDASHALPVDGAGGEGFDNAAETLFLSPIHAEKYLAAAKEALDYAAKDPTSRKSIFTAVPGPELTPDAAAARVLAAFLPRAFRRPVSAGDSDRYLALFHTAQKRGDNFDRAILYTLRAVLMSPEFLYRREPARPDSYSMASRLSYFLWGSMPDKKLFDLAAQDKLRDPAVVSGQVDRMLKDQESREFAERFVGQWLGVRELGRDIKPDEKLFPDYYDAETQGAIRYEPVLFLQELLSQDLSLLNLIDSNFGIFTNKTAKLYGLKLKDLNAQPKRFDLPTGDTPEAGHRGGVLGMAAVLAVSSYPQRTSPVLRGKWILENLLGTPPPPPPPNVPALAENHPGAQPLSVRDRLERHRANPVCASCHSRIDPLGFALENYDVLGRWRTEDGGGKIDASGALPDGSKIADLSGLKRALLDRKALVVRNLTSKMLGYALGRGLTLRDGCAVDKIAQDLEKSGYKAQVLIRGVVESEPFRLSVQ